MNNKITLSLFVIAAAIAVLLPELVYAYDGGVLKDELTALDKFIASGAARAGLGLVAILVTVIGTIKQSPLLIGIAVLGFVFLYLARQWIEATYTLLT